MLWQRVLTALVLIPLVVAGILLLDSAALAMLLAVPVLLGAYEMARLANLHDRAAIAAFVIAVGVAMGLAWTYPAPDQFLALQWLIAIGWLLVTLQLIARREPLARVDGARPSILLLGGLVLLSAWWSVMHVQASGPDGPAWLLFLFVLIWVADSGAYFAGRAFGRRKLAPVVSPGKTWAGAIGALGGAALCAVLLASSGWVETPSLPILIALALLVTLISIGGDLWVSRLKREAGVKDSGQVLPGHGGILDRIDSLLAAAPVYALCLRLAGIGA